MDNPIPPHCFERARYGPLERDGLRFVAHPFGYPGQHQTAAVGYRVIDV